MTPSSFWTIKTHERMPSTQDMLKELIESEGSKEEGLVIHALKQTKGHGRHGRQWESSSGNLSFSFMLCPHANRVQNSSLSLVTGIALIHTIRDFIDATHNNDIILKWPNDIILNGGKCAGILLENVKDCVVIGIGVNLLCAPVEGSTALSEYRSDKILPETFMLRFLEIFESMYTLWQKEGFSVFKPEYMKMTYKKGAAVSVKLPDNNIQGLFQDVDECGNMLILCKDTQKLQKITAGDVFLV